MCDCALLLLQLTSSFSYQVYPDEKALLPRHSHDLGTPIKGKGRKQTVARKIAHFVISFGVTWVLLDTLLGGYSTPVSRIGEKLSSTSSWIASLAHPSRSDRLADLMPLRPLSLEAQAIKNRCVSLPPFPEDVYRHRISTVRHVLETVHKDSAKQQSASVSAGQIYIMEPGASSLYYTGIGSQQWHPSERPFLFLISYRDDNKHSRSKTVLSIFTPAFEASRAKLLSLPGLDKDSEVEYIEWKEEENWAEVLVQYLKTGTDATESEISTLKLHFDPAVRSFISAGVAHALVGATAADSDARILMDVADPRILSVRERKSQDEIAVLKCANEVSCAICWVQGFTS